MHNINIDTLAHLHFPATTAASPMSASPFDFNAAAGTIMSLDTPTTPTLHSAPTATTRRRGKKPPKTERGRATHNELERKRRNNQRLALAMLGDAVDTISEEKPSMMTIMVQARHFIHALKSRVLDLEAQLGITDSFLKKPFLKENMDHHHHHHTGAGILKGDDDDEGDQGSTSFAELDDNSHYDVEHGAGGDEGNMHQDDEDLYQISDSLQQQQQKDPCTVSVWDAQRDELKKQTNQPKMSQQARIQAIHDTVEKPTSRQINWSKTAEGRNKYPSEVFADDVFTFQKMAERLPKPVYKRFLQQVEGRNAMDRPTADAVAHAVRVWAMERGATHFTHWFQPQTGTTAEKHDSFLTLKTKIEEGVEQTTSIDAFSGSQLLQSEPDASSFPNGGMRSTFEARGYTIWTTTSPMFLRRGPHGTSVLYIPSVFISYNGEALDEKTILLRSSEVLSNAAVRLLRVLGDTETKRVYTTLGTEQEFFLIDRGLYQLRPDLKITGRTLIGVPPPKHQQLEDHYFGQIPSRVLACISEAEYELYRAGVPIKTRHNEVAPNQFEVAPIFEEASVAVDHNLLTMEILHQVAHRHKLKVLFHEKPFKGVNGSGKHCNWSMSTDTGDNLLDPTLKPETNYRFLLFLVATLDAVHKHGGLLRAGIASASNEHRLGANEAPPGIVSAFLGDHLNEVLNALEEKRDVRNFSQPHLQTVKVGGTVLDLKVSSLPTIARDLTDRNRTSPFAFTGNKFEFRAVGSKQSPSFPVVLLNSAVAASINAVADALIKAKGSKPELTIDDILVVVRDFTKASKNIRFEGNGYSDEWVKEAEKRGLPNIKSCPVAFKQLLEPHNKQLLTSLGILSEAELHSRYHILLEKYAKDLLIEANTLRSLITGGVIPAAYTYRKDLVETLVGLKAVGMDANAPEKVSLETLTKLTNELNASLAKLDATIAKVDAAKEDEQGELAGKELTVVLEDVREKSDKLEKEVGDKYWPFPKYTELLF
ncbi:hypothetical protein HDV05_000298 [Chytridiales sp. JEL 0842]|nr:hypothetical protein HDV05_000298 [Chytridiales sp. JEL 0842]